MMARCKLNPCCGATMPGKCEPPPQIKPNEGWEAYEQRTMLASAPAPASGGVDVVREALLGYVLKPGQYETASAFARGQNRVAVDMLGVLDKAPLSPAATPVSEAGIEAIAFITKLVHMQSGQGWSRAVVRDAAANFLKLHGIAITGHADTTAEIAALAKPDPAPASVDAARERGWLIELKGATPSWAILNPRDYDEHWTADSTKAIRFAREADAQAYIDHIGWTEAFPSEHIWDDGRASIRTEGSR